MATFFMFGKYSSAAIKDISARRTEKADGIIKKYGGTVKSSYALLGDYDLVLIVDLPGVKEAMKSSIAIHKLTGISFTSSQAVPIADFDELAEEI